MNALNTLGKQTAEKTTESTETATAVSNLPDVTAGGINLGEQALAEEEAAKTNHYSSLPIASYALGEFQFKDGWLSLSDEKAAVFEEQVRQQPPAERNRITKYANRPTAPVAIAMTQGIDNSGNAPAAPSATQEA